MKSKITILLLIIFTAQIGIAQSIEELYQKEDFQELIKYAEKSDKLNTDELYYIGYAFFQLENDLKAIEMYDKAIEKGLDEDYIYFYKGLALRYNSQYDAAIKNFGLAIERNPLGQKNHAELGNCYTELKDYDTALIHLYKARALPYETSSPYLRIPNIFHSQADYNKALEEYKISADLINKEDPAYLQLLSDVGLLEFSVTKNYKNSIEAYEEVFRLAPEAYDLYPKLIKAFYANEEFEKGDSLFRILKVQYEAGNLVEDRQKLGNTPIAEFEWNNRKLVVFKYFKVPEEPLDFMYKVFLLSEDASSVDRIFVTEKTIQLNKKSAKHLLCENVKDGSHNTFAIGWTTDEIEYTSLKEAVISILDEGITPSASSNFSQSKPNVEKDKKKKKKKRKKRN